ncbi:hypothetical protein VDGL01_01787 [Verticillium dahliae]
MLLASFTRPLTSLAPLEDHQREGHHPRQHSRRPNPDVHSAATQPHEAHETSQQYPTRHPAHGAPKPPVPWHLVPRDDRPRARRHEERT